MSARRRRRTAPPKLSLVSGAAPDLAETDSQAADAPAPVHVIQTLSLGNVTRLVLLTGDPRAPFAERSGAATVEVAWGHAPPERTSALITELLEVLRRHGREWRELSERVEQLTRRGHLELVS